jgi:hypothetical protein
MDAPVSSPTFPGSLDSLLPPTSEDLDQFDEAQLREIHENEEIERFLRLFSTVCFLGSMQGPKHL